MYTACPCPHHMLFYQGQILVVTPVSDSRSGEVCTHHPACRCRRAPGADAQPERPSTEVRYQISETPAPVVYDFVDSPETRLTLCVIRSRGGGEKGSASPTMMIIKMMIETVQYASMRIHCIGLSLSSEISARHTQYDTVCKPLTYHTPHTVQCILGQHPHSALRRRRSARHSSGPVRVLLRCTVA